MARGRIVFTEEQIAFLVRKRVKELKPSAALDLRRDDAYDAFKELRWGWTEGRAVCPHCEHERIYEYAARGKFKCARCGRQFTAGTATPFQHRKVEHKIIISALSIKIHESMSIVDLAGKLSVNYRTAWRLADIFRLIKGNIRPKTREARWPYLPSSAKPSDDGARLLSEVNQAIPRGVPEQIRADVAQELVLGVLTGDVNLEDIKAQAQLYLRRLWKDYDWDPRHHSFDQPRGDGRKWDDVLSYNEHGQGW